MVVFFLLVGPLSPLSAQFPRDRSDDAFIERLEQQQLFQVIAWHSQLRFENQQLSQAERSTAAANWIRASTLSALNADPAASESAWNQVQELSTRLEAESRLWDRGELVQLQASLVGLAQARLIRLELRSAPSDTRRAAGLEAIRIAIDRLRQLQRDLVTAAAGAAPRIDPDPTTAFARPQLQALGNDVAYQLLVGLGVRADLYSAADRASQSDTFQQILERSRDLQPRLTMESKLWWDVQALALEAARQLDDWDIWQSRWETGLLGNAPPEVLGKMAAAQLMHDLDRNQLKSARAHAEQFVSLINLRNPGSLESLTELTDLSNSSQWPEWDIARARLFLSEQRQDGQVGRDAESAVLSFASVVAQRHGRFWSSELTSELLAGVEGEGTGAVSLLLVQDKIRNQRWEEVQTLISQGVRTAVQQRQPDQAIELANLAASTARSAGVQPWMIRSIEQAALAFPENSAAETTHYYACVLAANIDAERYRNAHEVWQRHVLQWPDTVLSDQVRINLLAGYWISHQQWDEALRGFYKIQPASPSYPAAVELMTATFTDAIQQAWQQDPSGARARKLAADWGPKWLSQLQDSEDGTWVSRWSLGEKKLGLLAIQAQLETADPNVGWTEVLMKRIENRPPDLQERGLSRKRVIETRLWFLKSPATFSSDYIDRPAEDFLETDLIWLARTMSRDIPSPGLINLGQSANQRGRARAAAQVLLQILELLEQKSPDAATAPWLELQQIRALLQVDRFEDAKQQALKLAVRQPDNLAIQQILGYCLAGSNNPTDASKAESHWRRLTQQTREDSDEWFEAKYYVAESLRRQGKTEDAFRLLSYLKLTHANAWDATAFQVHLQRLYETLAPN